MYAAAPEVQTRTYADLWQKGRYRVELTAELSYDPADVDAALQQLGYDVVDADQWGRTYHHNRNPNQTIELDEVEDPGEYIRLVLREGDLDESNIDRAEDQLGSLYARIYQMCQGRYDTEDCDAWSYPDNLEGEGYMTPLEDYKEMEIDL